MPTLPPPFNTLVTPLLTDLYQLTMTYAHWKNGRVDDPAIFELFFRKNPFGGEFTIFCGLDEVLKFIDKFSEDDIDYLKQTPALKNCDPAFWDFLRNLDCSNVTIYAMKEGTLAFPRIPLIVVEGPLGIAQLLETTLLTLVNYPSLLATNAARMVVASKQENAYNNNAKIKNDDGDITTAKSKQPRCVEFGLRRAQGPDGGFSASKYSAIGGFVGTSNVQAGKLVGLNIAGTHGHSYVQAYSALDEVCELTILDKKTGDETLILPLVLRYRQEYGEKYLSTNDGELAAFIALLIPTIPWHRVCSTFALSPSFWMIWDTHRVVFASTREIWPTSVSSALPNSKNSTALSLLRLISSRPTISMKKSCTRSTNKVTQLLSLG
jgi:nicotinate phosphoribosyltransferase